MRPRVALFIGSAACAAVACGARTDLGGAHASASDASLDDSGGGACHDEVIASESMGASALSLDGDIAFWGTVDGFVRTRDVSGKTTTLANEGDAITSIAVDAISVYYTITGTIRRVSRAGGTPTDFATNVGLPFALTLATPPPSLTSPTLYYVNYGDGIAAGSVNAVDGSGASIELMANLDTPGGLALDDFNAYVGAALAVVNQQAVVGPLFRLNKAGGDFTLLETDVQSIASVVYFGARVFYLERTGVPSGLHGGIRSIATSGGAPQTELATEGVYPVDFTIDASGIYATTLTQEKSSLVRAGSDGNPIELTSTPNVVYGGVRTSATAIYWTIGWTQTAPPSGASVRKICKS